MKYIDIPRVLLGVQDIIPHHLMHLENTTNMKNQGATQEYVLTNIIKEFIKRKSCKGILGRLIHGILMVRIRREMMMNLGYWA